MTEEERQIYIDAYKLLFDRKDHGDSPQPRMTHTITLMAAGLIGGGCGGGGGGSGGSSSWRRSTHATGNAVSHVGFTKSMNCPVVASNRAAVPLKPGLSVW